MSTPQPYNQRWWKTMRWAMMKETPICRICYCRLAETIDHIVPWNWGGIHHLALFYNEQNLFCLCKTCHNRKTGYEQANWQAYKTFYQAVIPKDRMAQIERLERQFGALLKKKLNYLRAENEHLQLVVKAKELSPLNQLWLRHVK